MRKTALALTIVLLAACSTNPATGKRMFNGYDLNTTPPAGLSVKLPEKVVTG